MLTALAPAKLNLTLHVTGQRDDGYHLLDSLVVFADASDTLTFRPAPDLRLTVTGPFAEGVPTDHTNLIIRAADLLRRMRGVTAGADITLEKQLPHAAGIGSGSSDAATTLKALAQMWDVPPLPFTAPEVALLGADVPVCVAGPAPQRMRGIGEDLSTLPTLPTCAAVLVNPRVAVPTMAAFDRLSTKTNAAMDQVPAGLDFSGFAAWLSQQRNDLQAAAADLVPEIARATERLDKQPAVAWTGMSGSGATCVALVTDMAAARQVARVIQVAEMGWWVTPANIM
ncbi:4-(cytidine 5'-diphospho)-2-C-methyl-D-erythritol kinase [Yoonia sp. 208BN28-4]|uniref:4-(cytidine 5'-diphospho)-2-C-methyl-D-erythritol kinase n=1 Tax=Yoonia sp. 208BN28-4 TaxID=3126505 RepID=UPI0030B0B76D